MKHNRHIVKIMGGAVAVISLAALISCGSGNLAGTGSGRSMGVITGFGSYFVNGTEFFSTSSTQFSFDGQPGSQDDLKLGMVVEVEGEFDENGTTGDSSKVTFEDLMEGPVDSVALDGKSIVVMGQDIDVDSLTIFDGFSASPNPLPSDLAPGVIVEVSGFPGTPIRATRIEKKADSFTTGMTIEIKGTVTSFTSSTFQIGNLIVDYSGITIPGSIGKGTYVEVKSTQNVTSNTMIASSVEEKKLELTGSEGEKVELQGIVNNLTPAVGDFELGGTPVEITGSLAGISLNMKLEVEGTFEDRNGTLVLVAHEISIEDGGAGEDN